MVHAPKPLPPVPLPVHSPWVCNCNHPWARHRQRVGMRVHVAPGLPLEPAFQDLNSVQRTDISVPLPGFPSNAAGVGGGSGPES
jgi:hypothetical protein